MGIKTFVKTFISKVSKDNIGVLASIVSWSIVTSLVPILVGLIAILLQDGVGAIDYSSGSFSVKASEMSSMCPLLS